MTMGATIVHGVQAETNPFMRWVLTQGLLVIIAVHVAILILAVSGFSMLLRYGEQLPGATQRRFRLSTELWLGLLIAVGLFVYANNLAVIVLGGSII